MEQRRAMLDAVERGDLTVSEACQMWGVSRETFYVWRRRRAVQGDAGLENRSSRPHRSPGRIDALLEGQIIDMRKAHLRWGARRIRAELRRRRDVVPPARSTIHQVLVRNGLIKPQREPKSAKPIRFRRSKANELWQTDATDVELTDDTVVQVVSQLDDHSRLCCELEAFPTASMQAAIEVFDVAAAELGLPESVLSDRGLIFTGIAHGCVNEFERHLWALGVYTINGRGHHPQTQGKIERYHRTLNEWIADNGPFDTIEELNTSLAAFRHHYNQERPHQGDGMEDRTPAEVFDSAERASVNPAVAATRCRRGTVRCTGTNGHIGYGDWIIGLGRAWARTQVRIVDYGSIIEIYSVDGALIRDAKPDYTRHYLGTGNPRGRPHRHD